MIGDGVAHRHVSIHSSPHGKPVELSPKSEPRPDGRIAVIAEILEGHDAPHVTSADSRLSTPDAVLVLAGEGPLRPEIEAQVRSAGIGERVHFAGAVPNSGLMNILRVCDLVVLPSTHEGFPVVIAESAAVSCAIVATSVGGIPEFLENGVSGVLVPPGSSSALRDAIGSVLNDRSRAQELGPNAQARALAVCDAQVVAERYEEIYKGAAP